MKTKTIVIIIFIIVINLIFFNINKVQADGISDVMTGGDNFISTGKSGDAVSINKSELKNTSDLVYNVLLVIGMCIAVIISGILGINFMIGSVEEKAQIKDALVPFIIGCIVVFGAFGFWKIAVDFLSDIDSDKISTNTTTTTTTEETDSSGSHGGGHF